MYGIDIGDGHMFIVPALGMGHMCIVLTLGRLKQEDRKFKSLQQL